MTKYPNLAAQNIFYLEDILGAGTAIEYLNANLGLTKGWLGIDTETISLDPFTGKLRLVQIANKTHRFIFDTWKIGEEGRQKLAEFLSQKSVKKIFHNAKYDMKFLRRHLGVEDFWTICCTRTLSQILGFGNMTLSHSLQSVLERFLRITIAKEEQRSDWSRDPLTESQLLYSATDAWYLLDLRDEMMSQIKSNNLQQIYDIEMNAVHATAEMEYNGIHLNWDKWTARTDKDEEDCKKVEWE